MPDELRNTLLQRAMQPSAPKPEPQRQPWSVADLNFLTDDPSGVSIPTEEGPAPFGSLNYVKEMGRILKADPFDVSNWISSIRNPDSKWDLYNDNDSVYDGMDEEQAGLQRYALIPQELKFMFNDPFEQPLEITKPEQPEILRDLEADNDEVYDYLPPELRDLQIRALINRKGPK